MGRIPFVQPDSTADNAAQLPALPDPTTMQSKCSEVVEIGDMGFRLARELGPCTVMRR
jgi:hypothetical protein